VPDLNTVKKEVDGLSLLTQAGPNVTENRNLFVGGSDVPTIMGLSKYNNQFQLAQQKLGIIKSDFKGNEYTQYGNIMEPQIRDYINIVNEMNFIEATRKGDRIRSNTDGYDEKQNMILEVKTHGKTPTLEIYKAQMQLYMYQFKCAIGWLAMYERPKDFDAEFDDTRLKIKVINRDNDYVSKILKAIDLFWERCEFLKNNPGASEHDFYNFGQEERGNKMNELQVKTLKFVPAIVEFNYDELAANLDENLKKYEGLTFTEDDIAEGKNTVAELRKGKKAVDTYRLETKKKLTKSVTDFENQCKQLNKKFDEVLNPLVSQMDRFEEDRKETKSKEVQEIIDNLVSDNYLDGIFAVELVIVDEYLNKGKSLKVITDELTLKAEALKSRQETYNANKEIIENTVEIANSRYEVTLTTAAYVSLLDHKDVKEIKTQILDDAQNEVEKQLERMRTKKIIEEEKAKRAAVVKETTPIAVEEPDGIETFFEVYKITGTTSQLDSLDDFMNQEEIYFEIQGEKE